MAVPAFWGMGEGGSVVNFKIQQQQKTGSVLATYFLLSFDEYCINTNTIYSLHTVLPGINKHIIGMLESNKN
jgi:hypothetical protein